MCNDAHFGCRSMHGIVSSYALYDDLVAEVSKQAKAACHYCILHKRGKVKILFFYLTTYFLCFFSFSLFSQPHKPNTVASSFPLLAISHSSSPLSFFPCYLSSVPCSLSLFLPPFLFSFLSLSSPSISPFPLPSLPRVSLSPSQHVIKSNLSGSVKAKQESWMGKIEIDGDWSFTVHHLCLCACACVCAPVRALCLFWTLRCLSFFCLLSFLSGC